MGSDLTGQMRILLSSPQESPKFQSAHAYLYDRCGAFLEETQRLGEIFVLDPQMRR
jgi:hypothetical protein